MRSHTTVRTGRREGPTTGPRGLKDLKGRKGPSVRQGPMTRRSPIGVPSTATDRMRRNPTTGNPTRRSSTPIPAGKAEAASPTATIPSSPPVQGKTARISSGMPRTWIPRSATTKTEILKDRKNRSKPAWISEKTEKGPRLRSLFLSLCLNHNPILAFCLAQESLSVTVRLKTGWSAVLS